MISPHQGTLALDSLLLTHREHRPTLPQTKTRCTATGRAGLGKVGLNNPRKQGSQPKAQGQTGPSSPEQPLSWGGDRTGPQGANLLSTFLLTGTLITFHFSQKLLLFLIGNNSDASGAMDQLIAALQLALAALHTNEGPQAPPALQQ